MRNNIKKTAIFIMFLISAVTLHVSEVQRVNSEDLKTLMQKGVAHDRCARKVSCESSWV